MNDTTNVVEIKKVTKMDQCREIYKRVWTRGFALNGKTQRGAFIELVVKELGASKHLAGTYYQNLSNQAAGQPLYKYNKNKPKVKQVTKQAVADLEQAMLLALPHQPKERWMVIDNGVEVHNFSSRAKAQEFAKVNGLEWKDRSKVA